MNDWVLRFEGYDPADERRREALCTVGNGHFATRGAWSGARAGESHAPGTYLAGCYNRLRDSVDGRAIENESLVNLPDWLPISFAIGTGEWLDPDNAEVVEHALELDLQRGVLTRRFRLRSADGLTTTATERRFVSMADRHLAGQELRIIPENWSGRLRIRAGIDGGVLNRGVSRYRRLSGDHLDRLVQHAGEDRTTLVMVETNQSHIRVAVAARSTVSGSATARPLVSRPSAYQEFDIDARAGTEVVVTKLVTIYSSRDPAISEPATAAVEAVRSAPGFRRALAEHVLAWKHLWRHFAIELDQPAGATVTALRLNLFHLIQSVSPDNADAGVPARGLHGEAYRGHIFWDELFVYPVLTPRMPAATRALLLYRCHRLPAARQAAREAGFVGAMYPWQSGSDGREESQRVHLNPLSGHWLPDATWRQRHVGLAVAYAIWQYVDWTGDEAFLVDHGAEVILEVARFFASVASYDPAHARYVIRGVAGPDEFHTGYPDAPDDGIDNNAYTDVMAVWVLRQASAMLDRLPGWRRTELVESLGLTATELRHWGVLTRRMLVPFHDGVISQFEGYADLAELDWTAYRRDHGDVRRLDRILEAEGRSVASYQVSKQADVVMLLYLLPQDELIELMAGLGYQVTDAMIRRTVEYYLARTCHGSSLSAVVHAWGLATLDADRALHFLTDALLDDLSPAQADTTAEGIHLGSMAGSVDVIQRCFTGMSVAGDELCFEPRWPSKLGTLWMMLRYRDHRLAVQLSADGLQVAADNGDTTAVRIRCCNQTKTLHPGELLAWPAPEDARS